MEKLFFIMNFPALIVSLIIILYDFYVGNNNLLNHIFFWLISSSSSSEESSDSDENFLEILLPEILQHYQKNENYVEVIMPMYTEKEFSEHFKIPRNLIVHLALEFEESEYYPKKETGFSRISAQKCLCVFVWYATHEAASFRDVSDRFDIAVSTLHIIIYNVAHFLSC